MRKFVTMLFATIILLAGCSNVQPVQVTTQTIQPAGGTLIVTHAGTLTLSDETEIFAPVSGNVMERFAAEGSDVTAGQPILKISELGPHSDLLQLKTELAKAKTDLAKALAANDESAAELKLAAEDLQAQVQALEEATAVGIIYAPKSGRLGSVDAPLGMQVTANETLIATVGYTNPVAVRFEVSAEEARLIATAQGLNVTLKFDDGTPYPIGGEIYILDGSTAEATFDNYDGLLLPGMSVTIELDGLNVSNALLVPANAVQNRDADNFVYVAENNKAAVKNITLGDKVGSFYIVKDGLKAGDSVIVEGVTNLREGTPIKN